MIMDWIVFSVIIAVLFILGILFWKDIRYYWKLQAFFSFGFLLSVIFLPSTFRKPGCVENMAHLAKTIAYLFAWMGVKYELRGAEYLSMEDGAIWATNHQQMIDILGCFNCITVAKRVAIIMKKELLYHPGGLAAKLYGVVFLDRSSTSSRNDVNKWAHDAREQMYKVWIHPEGTRHFTAFKTQCLLPFKKGAFHAAVAAQIPILPTVFSPYYFMNYQERLFGRGKVIMDVLPPIPTKGLTEKDVPELMNRVRDIMTQRYHALTSEVLSSLPLNHPVFKWIEDVS